MLWQTVHPVPADNLRRAPEHRPPNLAFSQTSLLKSPLQRLRSCLRKMVVGGKTQSSIEMGCQGGESRLSQEMGLPFKGKMRGQAETLQHFLPQQKLQTPLRPQQRIVRAEPPCLVLLFVNCWLLLLSNSAWGMRGSTWPLPLSLQPCPV